MGFFLFPIYGMLMGLRLAAIRAAEAPLLQGVIWNKQGAVAPKRTWGPIIFISKFKFL